jgi:hypothetical protein
VNYNLFTATATLSTQTVTLPVGTFTFGFLSGAGSIVSAVSTAVATGLGTITVGQTQTISVTTPGTILFTVTGTVNSAQLNVGSTLLAYRARVDATTVKILNLGTLGSAEDGTYTNGVAGSMLAIDTSWPVLNYTQSATQFISTTYTRPTQITALIWSKKTVNVANSLIGTLTGSGFVVKVTNAGRIAIDKSFQANIYTSAVGEVLTLNQWNHVAVTFDQTASPFPYKVFLNGIKIADATTTQVCAFGNLIFAQNNASEYASEKQNLITIKSSILSDTQIQNIYNSQKSQYGY